MPKDVGHSYVTLGIFLPDAVKSQVSVCIQSSYTPPIKPIHQHVPLHTPPPPLKDL